MSSMRDQMEALTQGIATSARERHAAVGDSRVLTARMLQASGRERAQMADALKSSLVADHMARSVNVCAIRANAGMMRQEFREGHVRMRRSLRRKLVQSTELVATLVAALRADVAKKRSNLVKAQRHMTKAQRAALAKDRRERSLEVAELINGFHVSRGKMAHELAASLAEFTQEITSQVSGLKQGARTSHQKARVHAWTPGPIPDSPLATQVGGVVPMPLSAFVREPEERKRKEGRLKTKEHGRHGAPHSRPKSGATENPDDGD